MYSDIDISICTVKVSCIILLCRQERHLRVAEPWIWINLTAFILLGADVYGVLAGPLF
jgi:hypothetical protein